MNLPILNRDFRKPVDDWYHIVPKGEYPGKLETPSGNVKVVQIVDDQAIAAMVRNFETASKGANFPGVLVDFDHFSYDSDKATEAAGWISDVSARGDGLWGKIRWSDAGETAISNGRYRMVSPVWLEKDLQKISSDQVRPTRLDTVALTNKPNMKGMVPLSNRDSTGGNAENQIMKNKATAEAITKRAKEFQNFGLGYDLSFAKATRELAEPSRIVNGTGRADEGIVSGPPAENTQDRANRISARAKELQQKGMSYDMAYATATNESWSIPEGAVKH